MTFNQIKMAIYATYLTNYYGFKLKKAKSSKDKKRIRTEYSKRLLEKLNLDIKVIHQEKLPKDGQYLLLSNHTSVIDPLIIEIATQHSKIFGHWISKKELYNSLFFGMFVQNAGTILLDRDASQMGGFFSDIKKAVKEGDSIYIFPEGARNKTEKAITEFKDGSRIIAVKNRLPILPVYVRTNANNQLMASLKEAGLTCTIEVEFGDIIEFKDRSISLQEAYKQRFAIV